MGKLCLKLLGALLISTVVLMLTACGPVYETTYSYNPPHSWEGRQCANECLSVKSHCQNRCQRNYQECVFEAQGVAHAEYREYERTHRYDHDKHHHDVSPDYFVDTSQCNNNCGCDGDYNQCYTNCGGAVIPHTRCVAFCNQKK